MSSSDANQMFKMLLDEIDDTLSDFENRCLKLNLDNPRAELNDLFRFAHNIKGASRIYGLNDFGATVHSLEDLLGRLRIKPNQMDPSVTDLLLRVHKFLSDWVEALRTNPNFAADKTLIVDEIQTLNLIIDQATDSIQPTVGSPNPVAINLPSIADLIKIKQQKGEIQIQKTAIRKGNVLPISIKENEVSTAEFTPSLDLVKPEIYAIDNDFKKRIQQTKKKRPTGNLRIASNKIDEIMQFIGELSIQQSILWHHHQMGSLESEVCKNAISLNQKTIKGLQEMILSLRMQPIEGLFQRIERSSRDLTHELEKKVILKMEGANVLMDKTVIERMTDPLIHLIRNAIDHGVEPEDERLLKNKSVPAVIFVTAAQDSGQVIIDIQDDGRGIDPEKIFAKARENGLIQNGQKLSEGELIKLIFEPGFSTKDSVTQISGRGVGMNVVQQAIQEIGGTIDIITQVGMGTRFHITIPTSLEIVDALIFKVNNSSYIVPTQEVREILEIRPECLVHLASGRTAIRLNDRMVPVEHLSDYLDFAEPAEIKGQKNSVAILVRLKDRSHVAFLIDEIVSQQQIVVRPLSDHLSRLPGFTAVGVLGNGEPALILSIGFIGECYFNWTLGSRDMRRNM